MAATLRQQQAQAALDAANRSLNIRAAESTPSKSPDAAAAPDDDTNEATPKKTAASSLRGKPKYLEKFILEYKNCLQAELTEEGIRDYFFQLQLDDKMLNILSAQAEEFSASIVKGYSNAKQIRVQQTIIKTVEGDRLYDVIAEAQDAKPNDLESMKEHREKTIAELKSQIDFLYEEVEIVDHFLAERLDDKMIACAIHEYCLEMQMERLKQRRQAGLNKQSLKRARGFVNSDEEDEEDE
jgi:hypothetical protein